MNIVSIEVSDMTLLSAVAMAQGGTVILTRRGKPLAALRDLSGEDWESVSLANNPRFRALIDESRRSYRVEGGVSLEEVRRQLELKKTAGKRPRKKSNPR
jgi:hypothetical protein